MTPMSFTGSRRPERPPTTPGWSTVFPGRYAVGVGAEISGGWPTRSDRVSAWEHRGHPFECTPSDHLFLQKLVGRANAPLVGGTRSCGGRPFPWGVGGLSRKPFVGNEEVHVAVRGAVEARANHKKSCTLEIPTASRSISFGDPWFAKQFSGRPSTC